jgi:hypothetical protein
MIRFIVIINKVNTKYTYNKLVQYKMLMKDGIVIKN